MNRKERRAFGKQQGPGSPAAPLLAEASRQHQAGKLDQAAKLYRRAFALDPNSAKTLNALACVLLDLGELEQASARFAQSITLVPEMFDMQYPDILQTLATVNPPLREALRKSAEAWPRAPSVDELFGTTRLADIVGDPLLRCILESVTVRDINLENVLTAVRTSLLEVAIAASAGDHVDENLLAFLCALAKQCFINEYIFATAPDEIDKVAALRTRIEEAIETDAPLSPLWPAAAATYFPLNALANAPVLLSRKWPAALRSVLRQQVEEPQEERELANSIPALTSIDDDVSRRVQQQYEESPFPRWVIMPRRFSTRLEDYLSREFPAAIIPEARDGLDVLVAGCGTGRHPIETACMYADMRLLAIDLSLASLAYAKRKTREAGIENIEYAQADILNLGTIGRTFDVISVGGVLHHMADPLQGWRVLVPLLRPRGFMQVALYSEVGRRHVVNARAVIAERGYEPTPEGIRRCRRELSMSAAGAVARSKDFYSTSECRDFLFHVQEHRMSIPEISSFLAQNGLRFIGFDIRNEVRETYAARFRDDPHMTNLDHWHEFETANPTTFTGMYQFWVQKN